MSDDISNPHDNFFRGAFALPEVATPCFQCYLLPGVLAELDLATLQLKDAPPFGPHDVSGS